MSQATFHSLPDAGAIFPTENGGWIYVSNSERSSNGGVGALTFNSNGDVIDYKMVLSSSRSNCGGGKTPWNVRIELWPRFFFFFPSHRLGYHVKSELVVTYGKLIQLDRRNQKK